MLNLKIVQNRQHVKCGQKTTLFALLEIAPDDSTRLVQKRHHVSLVIDCSGSMHGQKIEDAKDAAISLVNSLSTNDLVSIVTFSTEVEVKLHPTSASDSSIENVIRSITVDGATALHGGMATALQLILQTASPDTISRLEVFTDGEPNIEPYDDDDFVQLVKGIRDNGVTTDVFGIGQDYNGPLLMQIAEIGRGKWEHVSDSNALTKMVSNQVTEMQNTVIANPQLQITLMPGAELATIAITKPTLQEIGPDSRRMSGNITHIGLKDIIKDETQVIAMRIAVPPIREADVPLLTAAIVEGTAEVASQTGTISCTDDKELYNMELDPSPRVILASSEATVLFRKGLEGDNEATQMANTILKSLDDPETTKLMDADAHATVINAQKISGNIQAGISEEDKKQILHETTVIGSAKGQDSESKCPHCGSKIRPTSKICGYCGKNIKKDTPVND